MLFVCSLAIGQETYPSRPIRLIVSFTPGGGADLTARTVGQKMSESLRQPVVVENRPGANGLVGAAAVAGAAPDGYTLLLTDRGALGINPSLYRKLPYDPTRDFEYVGVVTVASYVLVSDPRLPARTLPELVKLAKAQAGKLNYASFGIASMAHLNIEALKARGRRYRAWLPERRLSRSPRRPGCLASFATVAYVPSPSARSSARRCCPMCRRSPKPVRTRTFSLRPTSPLPCPPERHGRSSTACTAKCAARSMRRRSQRG